MKFKVTHENITIDAPDSQVEAIVLAAVATLVPRFLKKLYFSGKPETEYQALKEAAAAREDLVILDPAHNTKVLVNKARIVHQDDGLFIVPHLHGALPVTRWKQVCQEIQSRWRFESDHRAAELEPDHGL